MNLRNKLCPCNSGKKYKKCCGSEEARNAQRHEAKATLMELLHVRAAEREREQEERRKAAPGAYTFRRSPMMGAALLAATMASASSVK